MASCPVNRLLESVILFLSSVVWMRLGRGYTQGVTIGPEIYKRPIVLIPASYIFINAGIKNTLGRL